MMYSVYQHWDPLKVCIMGRSYSPEFYNFIENSRARKVMERIAYETEEDYQKFAKLLESFNIEVLRPTLSNNYKDYLIGDKILPPPMTPRDFSIMLGNDFYWNASDLYQGAQDKWDFIRGSSWPEKFPNTRNDFVNLPESIQKELSVMFGLGSCQISEYPKFVGLSPIEQSIWGDVIGKIRNHANVYNIVPRALHNIDASGATRVGKHVYVGTDYNGQDKTEKIKLLGTLYPQYKWGVVDTNGHSDGVYCPVVPGLIVSLNDVPTYKDTFPGWEVIYLPDQSWHAVQSFLDLKEKNQGKWWVPGEELNDDFTDFVESWLGHWVGYVEETVFDVNMLVIDEKNVVCNNYNEKVFKAFERYGITPHLINFRHRYFWDGGLHCITSDVHREGTMKNYFPEQG